MSLAPAWVAGLMGLPNTESVGMTRIDSPSRTVLPVFFRQADASVVTSDVFEISCELNPQLKKDLQVLAISPEVVPAGFFFRTGYASDARDKLEAAMLSLHETPAGQQVLTMFQGDGMVKQPISCLESSRQLWEESGRSRRLGSN
jgi:phosphonate transport system substrate-binding protein